MRGLLNRRTRNLSSLFNGHYVDAKVLYVILYREIPTVVFVGNINLTQAFAHVKEKAGADIMRTYQHSYFDHEEEKLLFNNTILVLKNERIIELAGDFAHVLHGPRDWAWTEKMARELAAFKKEPEKERPVIGFARSVN